MTQVARIFEEEKRQAVTQVARIFEEEKRQAIQEAVQKHEEEKRQEAVRLVIKMLKKNYPTEEIASLVSIYSPEEIEKLREELEAETL